jgi:hypothetical protein
MSDYHYVSIPDLTRYVRRLINFFPTLQDFINDVEESIKQLEESSDNYADEIQFYKRVKDKLLVLNHKK